MKKVSVMVLAIMLTSMAFAQKGLPTGAQAPGFTATDQSGNKIQLEKALQNGPVVLLFYRGYWCPNCARLLKSVQDSLTLLQAKNVTVIAISPETPAGVAKTVANSKAVFPVISDEGLRILNMYQVAFKVTEDMDAIHKKYNIDVPGNNGKNGNYLPRPSAFVINQKGIITYRYFNDDPYSNPNSNNRITVRELLLELDKL